MTDQWLACYAKWDSVSQMAFSLAVLILAIVAMVMAGAWLLTVVRTVLDGLTTLFHGRPNQACDKKQPAENKVGNAAAADKPPSR